MLSLSEISRRVDLPRRTIQYWYDQNVLADGEIELARLLVPFAKAASPIGIVKLMASIFRDLILDSGQQSDLAPAVAAARAGKPAYLIAQIAEMTGLGSHTASVFAATNARDLGRIISEAAQQHGRLPILTINLTEALKHKDVE